MNKAIWENIGKLKAAQSAEDIVKILEAAGEHFSAEDAELLLNELKEHASDEALSLDELEAVSGGADRDWATDGCAATMEFKSHCGSNDYCYLCEVTYTHTPEAKKCPTCGTNFYISYFDDYKRVYKCKNCGFEITEDREPSFSSFGN